MSLLQGYQEMIKSSPSKHVNRATGHRIDQQLAEWNKHTKWNLFYADKDLPGLIRQSAPPLFDEPELWVIRKGINKIIQHFLHAVESLKLDSEELVLLGDTADKPKNIQSSFNYDLNPETWKMYAKAFSSLIAYTVRMEEEVASARHELGPKARKARAYYYSNSITGNAPHYSLQPNHRDSHNASLYATDHKPLLSCNATRYFFLAVTRRRPQVQQS